jgi:hypothetical protein
MKQLKTVPHLSDNELLQRPSKEKDLRAFLDGQIITAAYFLNHYLFMTEILYIMLTGRLKQGIEA